MICALFFPNYMCCMASFKYDSPLEFHFLPFIAPHAFTSSSSQCVSHKLSFHFLSSPLITLATCSAFALIIHIVLWINWNFYRSHCYMWIVINWNKSLCFSTTMSWWHSISPVSLNLTCVINLITVFVFWLFPFVFLFSPQL